MGLMRYELGEGRLAIRGPLTESLDITFDINCRKLLDSKGPNLVIDLSAVSGITSMYLGTLAGVASEASAQGRTLVVRANRQVADLIRQVGFDRIMTMEVVEEPPARP